jgi:hypothetical protein
VNPQTIVVSPTAAQAAQQAEADFQDKMRARMRAAMGDLMPDAVLASIVAKGLEEAFFKKQVRADPHRSSWSNATVEYPSWLVEFLEKECRARVRAAVEKWVAENPEKFTETVKEVVGRGVASAVVASFDSLCYEATERFKADLQNVVDSLRKV